MSSLVISGDTSGTVTVTVPAVAGTNTVTIPAATGTVMVSGNMPAFSAYQSVQQTSIGSGVSTKITFTTKEFDTNSNFASSTFTPTVAGYYQINAGLQIPYGLSTATLTISIYKNGSSYKFGNTSTGNNVAGGISADATVSSLVYCNGSTDYLEIYVYGSNNGSAYNTQTGIDRTYFNGVLVRTA